MVCILDKVNTVLNNNVSVSQLPTIRGCVLFGPLALSP